MQRPKGLNLSWNEKHHDGVKYEVNFSGVSQSCGSLSLYFRLAGVSKFVMGLDTYCTSPGVSACPISFTIINHAMGGRGHTVYWA